MKNKLFLTLWGSLGFMLLFLAPFSSFAIGIQPVRQEVEAKPGETIELQVMVVNETDKDFYAEPDISQFFQNNENGFPVFATEETKITEDAASWLLMPEEPVLVKAKESTPVKFKLAVPTNAEAGGKYLVVAYKPIKESSANFKVNVSAGSLLLINVAGEIIKSGELTDFSVTPDTSTDEPFSFNINYKNTGNTHLKPYGKIEIMNLETGEKLKEIANYADPDTGGKITSDFIPINLLKSNALPGSARLYKSEWNQNLQLGRFKALLSLENPSDGPAIEKTLEFSLNEKLVLESLELKKEEGKIGSSFALTIKNTGEGTQKLEGSLIVENAFGQQMDEIEIPKEWEAVEAGATKTYDLKWLEKEIPEGRFTAKLEAVYGFTKQKLQGEISFGKLDSTKIILVVALGIMIIITLTALFKKSKKKK